MHFKYEYAIAGANGQIGQVLAERLLRKSSVLVIPRGAELDDLPGAKHVINAAGYTKFRQDQTSVNRYWHDNIRLAVRLAHWADRNGSYFHQLSSEAVAEYRDDVMPEWFQAPAAHPKMIDYALSKVLTERAVMSILDPNQLSIYRCSDVVPDFDHFEQRWRHNHWLAILFSAGKLGFEPGDHFPVWIADVADMAEAIHILVEREEAAVHHLLGNVYHWDYFQDHALFVEEIHPHVQRLVDTVTPVVRIDPPLQECISQVRTAGLLRRYGFEWKRLEEAYWRLFAKRSANGAKGNNA